MHIRLLLKHLVASSFGREGPSSCAVRMFHIEKRYFVTIFAFNAVWGLVVMERKFAAETLNPREALILMTINIILAAIYGYRHKDLTDPDFLRHISTFGISSLAGVPKGTDISREATFRDSLTRLQS
ncbi:hypothetical protein BJ742DRAFT_742807 [Cladochytrium replicatum]|nr:hypothetical protein BJ742DRAFT_742807 [Cladochytrium replicatum]